MLHAMFSGRFDTKPDEDGTYFIDRDGTHFRYILNYLRTGELVVPDDKTIRHELLIEAKFYQVEGIIKALTPKPTFEESEILSTDQSNILTKWLKNTLRPDSVSVELLYRASRDGWAASNFHSCCDNKGPTVTVIKSGNYIFGGYSEEQWGGKIVKKKNSDLSLSLMPLSMCRVILANYWFTRTEAERKFEQNSSPLFIFIIIIF